MAAAAAALLAAAAALAAAAVAAARRGAGLAFADPHIEAAFAKAWLRGRRAAAAEAASQAPWLTACTWLFLAARRDGVQAPWAAAPPLLAPQAALALVAGLRGGWAAPHREALLLAARGAQAAGALALAARAAAVDLARVLPLGGAAGGGAPLVVAAAALLWGPLLARARFRAFAPSQLLLTAAAAAAAAAAGAPPHALLAAAGRLAAAGWAAPALAALAREARGRRRFVRACARTPPSSACSSGSSICLL